MIREEIRKLDKSAAFAAAMKQLKVGDTVMVCTAPRPPLPARSVPLVRIGTRLVAVALPSTGGLRRDCVKIALPIAHA